MRLILLLCCCLGIAAEDALADLAQLKAEMAALVALRDAVAAEQAAADPEDGYLELTLVGALPGGADLSVQLIRRAGRFVAGRGRAMAFSPLIFAVDHGGLHLDGDALSGSLRVAVAQWTDKRQQDLDRGVPRPGTWRCTGSLCKRSGEVELLDPAVAPYPPGARAMELRWIACSRPEASGRPEDPQLLSTTLELRHWADLARRCYEEVRAMELQARTGLPYRLALANVVTARWDYLPRAASAAAGAVDEAEEGDEATSAELRKGPSTEAIARLAPKPGRTLGGPGGPEPDLDLDDLGEELDEDPPGTAEAVRQALAHVRLMRAAIEAWRTAPDHDGVVAELHPLLQPRATEAMPERDGIARLPEPGTERRWVHLDRLRCIGPFLQPTWDVAAPLLPDLLPLPDAALQVDAAAVTHRFTLGPYSGPAPRPWQWVRAHPTTAEITPPVYMKWSNYDTSGMNWAGFYAWGEFDSPVAQRVWIHLTSCDLAELCVNGRHLFSASRVAGDATREAHRWCVTADLVAGRNTLLVRCDNRQRPHWLRLHIGIGGDAAAEVAEPERAPAQSPLAGVQGFRGDHSGVWQAGAVPVAWDLESGANVRWFTGLGDCNAAVTLLDRDRVLTCEERFTLVCLARDDGRVLWRHDADPLEVVDPQAFAASRAGWQAMRDGDAAARDEIEKLYQRSVGFTPGGDGGFTGNAMSTPLSRDGLIWWKVGSRALACLDAEGRRRWFVTVGGKGGGMSHPISSPVLLDDQVIVQVPTYGGGDGLGEELEPAWEDVLGWPDRHRGRRQVLRAFDAGSGEVRWTSRQFVQPHHGNRYDADGPATPHPMRLVAADGSSMDVLLTIGGAVFRATDGALLLRHCGWQATVHTPSDDGAGTVYLYQTEYGGHSGAFGRLMAVDLVMEDRERIAARLRWSRLLTRQFYGGALVDGDRLQLVDSRGTGLLWTVERERGEQVAVRSGLFPFQCGHAYVPLSKVGDRLYVCEDGRSGYNKNAAWRNSQRGEASREHLMPGGTAVCSAGALPQVLARNYGRVADGATMPPAFADGAMYLRTRDGLLCVADSGAAGRRYQAETVARTLLADLQVLPPAPGEALEASAETSLPHQFRPEDLPVDELCSGWWVTAPTATPEPLAEALRFPHCAGLVSAKRDARIAGSAVRDWPRKSDTAYPSDHMVEDWRLGLCFDLVRVHGGETGSTCFWSTIVAVDRERVLRLDQPLACVEVWVGGTRLAHGQRIRLPRGAWRISMRSRLPADAGAELRFTPRFWASDSLETERARRAAAIAAAAPWLEAAAVELGEEETGRRCRELLDSR